MKFSVIKSSFVIMLSMLMLTGFTCSKHIPEKAPENITENPVPQDQMTTDQTTSGDNTPAAN